MSELEKVIVYCSPCWGKTTSLHLRMCMAAASASREVILMPPHFTPPKTVRDIEILKPSPIPSIATLALRPLKTTPRQRAMPNQPFYAPFVKRGRRSF